ncbi:hypothetical protein [Amycolatopsis sp. NPDC098790]|uniref:hypothetical protein n=1 Tax=Amycolatopsis sp. NPDC098790 TaxID=3363939 RepID=UPI00382D8D84
MSAELEILLVEYQALREDDRGTSGSQSALASVFVALLAGLFAILVGDCRFRGAAMAAAKSAGSCYDLPEPVYVAAPALPFAVLCYIIMLGTQVTIKSFYMRAIENELRRHRTELRAIPGILAGSATELVLAITSPRRGRRSYFVMLLFLTLSFAVALGGWVVFVALSLSVPAMIAMFALYAPLLALLLQQGILANTGCRKLLHGAAEHLRNSRDYPLTALAPEAGPIHRPGERSLLSYLVLPRPLDTVKWTFIPIAYAVGAVTAGQWPGGSGLLAAAAGWLVFEYLIYQGRYQWNDIRGLADDQNHPARRERGRLPVSRRGPLHSVALSTIVIVARAVLAVVIAFTVVPSPVSAVILISFAGVWVPAWLYEFLRAGTSRPGSRAVAIWLVVGVGYAVRASAGLALAGIVPHGQTAGTFFLFAAAAWAFGIVFVTLTWVLEAIGHCAQAADGTLEKPAGLVAKPHLERLLRFTPFPSRSVPSADGSAASLRALTGKSAVVTPWNAGLVVATVCGIAACAHGGQLLLTVAGGLAAGFVVLTPSVAGRWVVTVVTVAALGLTAASVGDWRGTTGATAVAGLFFVVYCVFRQSAYQDLRDALKKVGVGIASLKNRAGRAATWLVMRLVGRRTWALVTGSAPPAE